MFARVGPGEGLPIAKAGRTMTTTIGLIGAGHIGSALAQRFIDVGHDVLVSNSRRPERLTELVATLGPKAHAVTAAAAAQRGDIVVVTVPLKNYLDIPTEGTDGKVVIDTNNCCPTRDGHFAELDNSSTTSSELLAAHLATARVVRAFNQIAAPRLVADGKPTGTPDGPRYPQRATTTWRSGSSRTSSTRSGSTRSTPVRSPLAHSSSPAPLSTSQTSQRRPSGPYGDRTPTKVPGCS